jgi:cell division protein FtsI/penicillin-binding protein 2
MFVPHLLKEFKEIGAVGDPDESTYRPAKPAFTFQKPEPKIIAMTPEQHNIIVDGMIGAVAIGTAKKASLGGLQIAGKTGTAQVAQLGQDLGHKKDHAWFVSFAPAHQPELSVIGLIENSGFGGDNAAPAVRGVYSAWLSLRNGGTIESTENQVAKK